MVLDAADTVAWLSGILPEIGHLGFVATVLVVFRTLTASAEGMAAWLVIRRAPAMHVFVVGSLVAAAVLTTLIVGFGLAPTDIPPGTNRIVVAFYWAVAAAALAWRGRATARSV